MASSSPIAPPFVTLHLYLPSGEFIVEDFLALGRGVERYKPDLEDGVVCAKLGLYGNGICP